LLSYVIQVAKIAPKFTQHTSSILPTHCTARDGSIFHRHFIFKSISTLYRQNPNVSKNSAAHQKKFEHTVQVLLKAPGISHWQGDGGFLTVVVGGGRLMESAVFKGGGDGQRCGSGEVVGARKTLTLTQQSNRGNGEWQKCWKESSPLHRF
jgi:hypothetical protein